MSAHRRVRRQSSLPGLSTAAIASLPPSAPNPFVAGRGSQPVAAGVPIPVPGVPGCTVTPMAQAASSSTVTPYTFTFTANVTPSTYTHVDAPKQEPSTPSTITPEDPTLSPDASNQPPKKRNLSDSSEGENPLGQFYSPSIPMQQKQDSHSRRVPEGHIPRPPNAFILFRSDLVQRKAVPSSLEADHSTISKIIGVCWRTLPPRQRKRWEEKAAEAKALHKKMYPNYRYAPVHRKDKKEKRPKQKSGDEERSLDIAGLLLQGHTGEDLSKRMSSLDALKKRSGVVPRQQPQAPKEYTFVQGMPNSHGEHTPLAIQAPVPHLAGPGGFSAYGLMHRRSSSAPPADAMFMHHDHQTTPTMSTSNVSTPLARASTLAPDSQSPAEPAEVPLSRITRNLPRDGKVPKTEGKKTKSTISKTVKAKASGKPGRKRGDDFIQSVWTAHAVADEQRKQQQQLVHAPQGQQTPHAPSVPGVQPTWALNDAPPPPSIAPSPAPSVQSFHSDYSQQLYGQQQQMDCFHSGFAPYGQQAQMPPNIFDPQAEASYGDFGAYGYSDVGSGYVESSNPMAMFRNPFDPAATAGTPPGDSPLSSHGFEYFQEQPFPLGLGGEHGIQGTWSTPGPPNPGGMAMDISGYTDPSMVDPLQPLPPISQPIPALQTRYGGSEGSGADSSNPHSPASNEGMYAPVLPHSQVPPLHVPGMHLDTSSLLLSAPQHSHGYEASPTAELTEHISQFHMQDWTTMNPMSGMDINGNPLAAAGAMDIACAGGEWTTQWTNPNPFSTVEGGNRVVGVTPDASSSAMGLSGYDVDPLAPSPRPPQQDTRMTFVT